VSRAAGQATPYAPAPAALPACASVAAAAVSWRQGACSAAPCEAVNRHPQATTTPWLRACDREEEAPRKEEGATGAWPPVVPPRSSERSCGHVAASGEPDRLIFFSICSSSFS